MSSCGAILADIASSGPKLGFRLKLLKSPSEDGASDTTASPSASSCGPSRERKFCEAFSDEDGGSSETSIPTARPSPKGARPSKPRWADMASDDEDESSTPSPWDAPVSSRSTEGSDSEAAAQQPQGRQSFKDARQSRVAQEPTKAKAMPVPTRWTGNYTAESAQTSHPAALPAEGAKSWAGSADKFQCQFTVGIEEDSKFRVTRRILGNAGVNMKRIAEETGVKLRLRGRGSKFLEGAEKKESSDPLMLCVSAQTAQAYDTAVPKVRALLERIYREWDSFCLRGGKEAPGLKVQLHEGARKGARPSRGSGAGNRLMRQRQQQQQQMAGVYGHHMQPLHLQPANVMWWVAPVA